MSEPRVLGKLAHDRLLEAVLGDLLLGDVAHRHDDGRIAHNSELPVHDLRELLDRAGAVLALCLAERLLEGLALRLAAHFLGKGLQMVCVCLGIPDLEIAHLGKLCHCLVIGVHTGTYGLVGLLS